MKASAVIVALVTLSCGGKLDASQEEAARQFDLCVTYCTLNRAGSETTECYQPLEECPVECEGVTYWCAVEVTEFTRCQVDAGAPLICQKHNGELYPWVDFIDDVCEQEKERWDECACAYLGLSCSD